MEATPSIHPLLTPKQPSNRGNIGRLPHRRYHRIRSLAESIVLARDDLRLSDSMAARRLKFSTAKDFAQVYELLKSNGRRIVENNDWGGVEEVIYSKWPSYHCDPRFVAILREFGDPRASTFESCITDLKLNSFR